MKKHFLLLSFTIALFVAIDSKAQDIIKTNSGVELKTKLLTLNKNGATYKTYDDPEFSTFTIPYKEIASIQKEGEKKPVYFNHKLPRAFIGGSFGPSLPIGAFGITNYNNSKKEPGFAEIGYAIKLEAGFYLKKNLGLVISVGSQTNNFKYDKYAQIFNPTGSQELRIISPGGNEGGKSTGDSKWQLTHIMIGPLYSKKITKRLTLDLNAKIGLISTTRPKIYMYYMNNSSPSLSVNVFLNDVNKQDLSYSLGANIRYAITKRIAFYLGVNYFHTSPTINNEVETTVASSSTNSTRTITNYSTKFNLSSLNPTTGLVFMFKRKGNKFE